MIEQTGGPRDLYEHPANEFVMSFVGQVNRLDDAFVRPHDLELTLEPNNGTAREALIERVLYLGFEVRVELVRDDGERMSVQLTRDEAERLEIESGQIVFVQPDQADDVLALARLPLRPEPASAQTTCLRRRSRREVRTTSLCPLRGSTTST